MLEWFTENWDQLAVAGGAFLTFISVIVALTPTPRDNQWLERFMDWLSFLKPRDADGTLQFPLLQRTKPKKSLPKYTTPWKK